MAGRLSFFWHFSRKTRTRTRKQKSDFWAGGRCRYAAGKMCFSKVETSIIPRPSSFIIKFTRAASCFFLLFSKLLVCVGKSEMISREENVFEKRCMLRGMLES